MHQGLVPSHFILYVGPHDHVYSEGCACRVLNAFFGKGDWSSQKLGKRLETRGKFWKLKFKDLIYLS